MTLLRLLKREKRRAERLRYPVGTPRPLVTFITAQYPIVDLAEKGVKFSCATPAVFNIGQRVTATLVFTDEQEMPVVGKILRKDADGVVVVFDTVLPPARLDKTAGHDQRAFFRLRYPLFERPSLRHALSVFEVCEISEYGIRVSGTEIKSLDLGMMMEAALTFHDGVTLLIEGTVYRIERSEAVIRLAIGIPEQRVMAEQRYLIQKYNR